MTAPAGGPLALGLNGRRLVRRRSRPAWRDDAACLEVPTAVFYVGDGGGAAGRRAAAEAKQVCAGCPVRLHCLAWAIATSEQFGIWGGATERERRFLRRMLATLVEQAGQSAA